MWISVCAFAVVVATVVLTLTHHKNLVRGLSTGSNNNNSGVQECLIIKTYQV